MSVSADVLVAIVGGALSLLFGIVPPSKRWFEIHVTDDWKPGFMALVLAGADVIALLFFSHHVTAWPAWGLPAMDWTGIWNGIPTAFMVWLAMFGANQGTYLATIKKQKDRQQAEVATLPMTTYTGEQFK